MFFDQQPLQKVNEMRAILGFRNRSSDRIVDPVVASKHVPFLFDHRAVRRNAFLLTNFHPAGPQGWIEGQCRFVEVLATATNAKDLEDLLTNYEIDVLILDIFVPTSLDNPNPYPLLHDIPKWLRTYPSLAVLVISIQKPSTHSMPTLENIFLTGSIVASSKPSRSFL